MQRILLMIIVGIMNTVCLYSQILPELTEVELLKGKVKKIETRNYNPHTKRTLKEVSEYDSLERITSKIIYYKKNPHKEYFSYNSIGNVVLSILENNDGSRQHHYEYKYDDRGRIISQLELWDGKFSISYDSIIYNSENLPIQYLINRPYSSTQTFIRYLDGSNNEKIRYIESKSDLGIRGITNSTIEELRMYNDNEFLTKRKRKMDTRSSGKPRDDIMTELRNEIEKIPPHIEEYDFLDYKYDKHGNWTERKCYLNWNEKGSKFHLKEKRKIVYYK